MLRIGIIGAGVMGSGHARNLTKHVENATVVALSDISELAMEKLAAELGSVTFTTTNPAELVAHPDVDAIIIASPDFLHSEHIRLALAENKSALCEKPLAVNLEEARLIAKEIETHENTADKRLIHFGFQRRFDPAYRRVRDLINSGNFGAPLFVRPVTRNVKSTDITTPQMYSNIAIHDFDIYRWLFQSEWESVETISGKNSSMTQVGLKDPLLFTAKLSNGIVMMADIVAFNNYGYDARFEVVCEKGSIEVGIFGDVVTRTNFVANSIQGGKLAENWMGRFADAYVAEATAWVETVLDGVPNRDLASFQDALAANVASEMGIASL